MLLWQQVMPKILQNNFSHLVLSLKTLIKMIEAMQRFFLLLRYYTTLINQVINLTQYFRKRNLDAKTGIHDKCNTPRLYSKR